MPTTNHAFFWKKKEFVSFLLSILVFLIHADFGQGSADGSLISIANQKASYFFCESITRFAVPMFFMLSGITFFKDYSNKKYLAKIKSRLFTLVIPYLLWNTIWMLWEIFTSHSFLARFSTGEPFPLTPASTLKGIFFYGCNPPFWFIFDLIIFSFAAPLVFFLIRNKYVGIITVVFLSVGSLFGFYLPMDVFYYPMAFVFYLMGAMIGYHFFDFAAKKASKPQVIGSLIFLVAYILAKNIAPRQMHIDNYFLQTVVYTLAACSVWNVVDLFIENMKPRAIYRRSFAIYAMHLNIAIVLLKVFSLCLPESPWLEIPKFVVMVILTLVIIHLACVFLEKFAPKIYGILMGSRQVKQ